jgi:hypothetical protein
LTGERAQQYAAIKFEKGKLLLTSVHNDIKQGKTGVGGCYWEDGADPSTIKCSPINPDNDAYAGYAQPVESPMYTDKPGPAMRGLKPPPKFYGNENNPRRRAVRYMT